jgi:GAF domain-containing protein
MTLDSGSTSDRPDETGRLIRFPDRTPSGRVPVASPADRVCPELAAIRIADQPVAAILQRAAELAHGLLPAAACSSVAVIDDRRRCTFAVSGPLAAVLDERQYPPAYGPATAVFVTGAPVEIPDTAVDDRFTDFSPQAARHGVRWTFSLPVPLGTGARASVTSYGAGDPLDDADRRLLAGFTMQVAATLANSVSYAAAAERADQLQEAMASRATIEQAKGIIMDRRGCTPDDAFAVLREASTRSNRKLRDIARVVVVGVQDQRAAPRTAGGNRLR